MPMFIQRRSPVEARQVSPNGVDRCEVAAWCDGYATINDGDHVIFIRSIGFPDRWCKVGDWIVKVGPGNFQQMNADYFEANYELATAAASQPCSTCDGAGEILGAVCYGGKPSEDMIECPDCSAKPKGAC